MEFEELKQNWQSIGGPEKEASELERMTRMRNHPALRRVRTRLLIEGSLILAFLALYYSALDGDQKPLWANLMLLALGIVYIGHHLWNWWALQRSIKEPNLIGALRQIESTLSNLRISSLLISALWGLSLISFLMYPRTLIELPWAWLCGILLTLSGLLFMSHRIWESKISQIQIIREDLESEA